MRIYDENGDVLAIFYSAGGDTGYAETGFLVGSDFLCFHAPILRYQKPV
ncbi:MAG: hypothetical protein HW399_1136 [Dehalococcoidia bacterium]|nr:hypothetical protein [Dehalococcoidia bacterium]